MSFPPIFSPSRRALNPVLADDALMLLEGSSEGVFYTPRAQYIEERIDLIIAGASGVFLLAAWLFTFFEGPVALAQLLTLFAFAIAGLPALAQVWEKLRRFRLDVDLLMLIGAVLAAWIGSPFEGALLLFLFALSGAMETHALQRTQSAIIALRDLSPKVAMVMKEGVPTRVHLRYVGVGDRVLVRPGERVPVDGVVVAGQSSVDEAAITGESVPRDCTLDDKVFAGTQNLNGRLEIDVTRLASDTTLAKIVNLVTQARRSPAKAQRLIDRIGPTYSVVVIVGSVAVGLINAVLFDVPGSESVRRAIAALIVASPCALIIATPVAYLSAIAAAARRGVLVKGGVYLETIAKAGAIVFDKTGTLTTGRVRVTDVVPPAGLDEPAFLRLIGALERTSHHPLAEAVSELTHEPDAAPQTVDEYVSTPGEGVEGVVDGRRVWIGRPDRAGKRATDDAVAQMADRVSALRAEGKTTSAVVVDGSVGLIAFRDTTREGSKAALEQLRRQGVSRLEMLTGDHEVVARRVASELALDGFQAELAPEDKLTASNRIREQYGPVVLVGDGINDAPALAHADAGIAMGAFGADIAMDAAHVVLMKDRIELVAWLHGHALRTAGVVKQNLTLAIGVISILSVFAAMGSVPLPLAVIGHEGSTVIVALNALRLLKSRE